MVAATQPQRPVEFASTVQPLMYPYEGIRKLTLVPHWRRNLHHHGSTLIRQGQLIIGGDLFSQFVTAVTSAVTFA